VYWTITEYGISVRFIFSFVFISFDPCYVTAFKIASWNVAGLRAVLKKTPDALSNMCKKHDLDMLCLQETKLQESHLDDPKLKIRGHLLEDDGYDAYYSCSTAKKGYSGTAVFIKRHCKKSKQKTIGSFFSSSKTKGDDKPAKKEPTELPVSPEKLTPEDVSYKMGKEIDAEGRIIMVDLPFASIANVYVPNSGQTLQRLSYRTGEWDKEFLEFMQKREKERGLPVIWLGDLNVAHTALDVWNDGAKHLAKQAGVTAEERAMFQEQLDAGFVDAFRKLHGSTTGQYSYWSQRAGNREPNKGLRLDYFICSLGLFSEESNVVVRDSYMLPDELGSDHCPVVIELEIKSK
jgi:exodeoxyribonuclease-3